MTELIQTSAHIVAGDSGGPLYNAARYIIGMDTAAITDTNSSRTTTVQSYAIPITRALHIANQFSRVMRARRFTSAYEGYPK